MHSYEAVLSDQKYRLKKKTEQKTKAWKKSLDGQKIYIMCFT